MSIDYKIFSNKDDLEKQRLLFQECFPENIGTAAVTEDHYFWKFHSFPAVPHSYEYAAFENNDIIGYYAALPYKYHILDKMRTVGMVCDVMTGANSRGKGVFTRLGAFSTDEMAKGELSFTTGFPIRPEVIPGHLKVNWEIMFDLPMYISFVSVGEIFQQYKVGFLKYAGNLIVKLYNNLTGLASGKLKDCTIDFVHSNEIDEIENLDEFLEKWNSINAISLNKNKEFINWRLNAPERKYKLIVLRLGDDIIGLSIVRKIIKNNIPTLAILDFMLLEENRYYSGAMHSAIRTYAEKQKLSAIIIMLNNSKRKSFRLFTNGYVRSPYKFTLIVKKLAQDIDMSLLRKEKNWHLTWLDSDDL